MAIDSKDLENLKECQANNQLVFFHGDKLDIVFQTRILEVEKNYVALINRVPPEYISSLLKSKTYYLQSQLLRFSCQQIDTDGENILFPLKELRVIEETRSAQRFPFDADEKVVCEILNPWDDMTILRKQVLDMSATGLSIRSPRDSALFYPGQTLNEIKVMIDGEPYTRQAAEVIYQRKLMDERGKLRLQIGLKFKEIQ